MASIFDVCKYILQKESSVPFFKMQKILYYTQAWSLAWTGKKLFKENFYAGRGGPVCKEMYKKFANTFDLKAEYFSEYHTENLTEDEKDTIDKVLKGYEDTEYPEMARQVVNEKPWRKARKGNNDADNIDDIIAGKNIITKKSMKKYYTKLYKKHMAQKYKTRKGNK